jgi:hypothetical protein
MVGSAISRSFFEGDNPYAATRVCAVDAASRGQVDLFGARARYEVEGRDIEVYWSHWTGWESYAIDGRLVAAFRNWSLRHRQSIELDSQTGRSVVAESSVIPAFGVRIWNGGRLVFEDHAPVKRAFDCAVAALLAICIAIFAITACCLI